MAAISKDMLEISAAEDVLDRRKWERMICCTDL